MPCQISALKAKNMATLNRLLILFLLFPLISAEIYRVPSIVHTNNMAMPKSFNHPEQWYSSILQSIAATNSTSKPELLHIYSHVIQGFSATLSPAYEYESLRKVHGFITVYSDQTASLHTTYTPKFLSLNNVSGIWPVSNYGDDIIVGIIDSGIWPESPSFREDGMSPVPTRWKGKCDIFDRNSYALLCNRKLVGARSFNTKGIARDVNGHGTCTASIIAGNYVDDASFFGYATGTSVGIAPRARVAVYNVVGDALRASASDVLAGIDAAIVDAVDLILVPMGIIDILPLYQDPFAIAAFSANKRGIPVIFSAGNEGPYSYSVQNGFPWAVTVGAGSIDRQFGGKLTLGNGLVILGVSLFPASGLVVDLPLVYNETISVCNESLSLAGQIVICNDTTEINSQMANVDRSNVSAAVFISDNILFKEVGIFTFPGIMISSSDAKVLIDYVESNADPRATIEFQHTFLGARGREPTVAAYSSRGPNNGLTNVLKPDLIAPGTRVLGAWPETQPAAAIGIPSTYWGNLEYPAVFGLELNLSSTFIIHSGTSLASAHVAGVAALLKAAHPEWSPAAIRSAMVTTANPLDKHSHRPIRDDGKNYVPMPTFPFPNPITPALNETATPFAMGAGHVDPDKALDPGLVYDADEEDYVRFLCASNYTEVQIAVITGSLENHNCLNSSFSSGDLNYPSFTALFRQKNSSQTFRASEKFTRTVTNIGDGDGSAVYRPTVIQPEGYLVSVIPDKLVFRERYEKLNFTVFVDEMEGKKAGFSYGSLTWVHEKGEYVVRSPIVIVIEEPAVAIDLHPEP